MNQTDALKRLEALEAQERQRDLQPLLERLSAETGISADEILIEAERLETTYGANVVVIEYGIAQELGVSVEQVRDAAQR